MFSPKPIIGILGGIGSGKSFVARLFGEIADYLEVKGENPFRVRAYRRAAQTLETLTEEASVLGERRDVVVAAVPVLGAAWYREELARRYGLGDPAVPWSGTAAAVP